MSSYREGVTHSNKGPIPLFFDAPEFKLLRPYNIQLHDKIKTNVQRINITYDALEKSIGETKNKDDVFKLERLCVRTLSKFWELLRYCSNDLKLETAVSRRIAWLDNHFRMLIHVLKLRYGCHVHDIHGVNYWQKPFPLETMTHI